MKLDAETLKDLVEERLPRGQVRAIQSSYKDADRFDKYVRLLQQRVPWQDQIVLPFGEHLFIVLKEDRPTNEGRTNDRPTNDRPATDPSGSELPDGKYVVKCKCGHEFCDYRENWKLDALIHVRETDEELQEIYPEKMCGDPRWNGLREYFCPGCKTLLEVEAVPPGYPVVHDFLPDLEGFYEQWLGRELPGYDSSR